MKEEELRREREKGIYMYVKKWSSESCSRVTLTRKSHFLAILKGSVQ